MRAQVRAQVRVRVRVRVRVQVRAQVRVRVRVRAQVLTSGPGPSPGPGMGPGTELILDRETEPSWPGPWLVPRLRLLELMVHYPPVSSKMCRLRHRWDQIRLFRTH